MNNSRNVKASVLRYVMAAAALIMALLMIMPAGLAEIAYADEKETTYSIFVYSGKEGYFGDPDTTMKKVDGLKYGDSVTIDLSGFDLKVKDPDKYYVRGLKIAGHDNDQLSTMQFQSYTFTVKEDMAFTVAYGMAGGMVKYTVKYVDEDGKSLRDDGEYYGMPGDMPVVAFRLIKGYKPNDYNLTRTLTDNEADNIFTFTYHKVEPVEVEGDGEDEDEDGRSLAADDDDDDEAEADDFDDDDDADADDDDDDRSAAGNAAGNGAAGIYFTGVGEDADDDPDEITNLDDEEEDEAEPGTKESDALEKEEEPKSGVNPAVAGGIAGAVVLAGLLYLILHKK